VSLPARKRGISSASECVCVCVCVCVKSHATDVDEKVMSHMCVFVIPCTNV